MDIDPKLSEKLRKTGLSQKEAAVYMALIEMGGGFPSKIAEMTKLNRSTVYKVLSNLSVYGLISEIEKRKKFFYQPEHPRSIKRFAQSRVTAAQRGLEGTEIILPVLEGLFANASNKPVVRFFEGVEGVLRVYEDHVTDKTPYEMLAFSNTADLMQLLSEDFRLKYIKRKEKLGITTRAILPDQKVDIQYNQTIYKNFPKNIWPKLKHVSRKVFPYKSDLTIYEEKKVSIINFNGPQFSGTIIEDQVIHDMMKMIFELAWQGTT